LITIRGGVAYKVCGPQKLHPYGSGQCPSYLRE